MRQATRCSRHHRHHLHLHRVKRTVTGEMKRTGYHSPSDWPSPSCTTRTSRDRGVCGPPAPCVLAGRQHGPRDYSTHAVWRVQWGNWVFFTFSYLNSCVCPWQCIPGNSPKAGEWLRCQRGWCLFLFSFPFCIWDVQSPPWWSARPLSLTWFCVCTKLTMLLHSCLTPWDPMDCSPPGSSVHGISQARILEWVAMPSSGGSSRPRDRTWVSFIPCTGRGVLHHQRHLGSPYRAPVSS